MACWTYEHIEEVAMSLRDQFRDQAKQKSLRPNVFLFCNVESGDELVPELVLITPEECPNWQEMLFTELRGLVDALKVDAILLLAEAYGVVRDLSEVEPFDAAEWGEKEVAQCPDSFCLILAQLNYRSYPDRVWIAKGPEYPPREFEDWQDVGEEGMFVASQISDLFSGNSIIQPGSLE